ERIRNQFQPLFDPASEPLSPEILAVNSFISAHAGYPLYDAQLAVAESVKRQLTQGKCAFIVAECGSGKTKIGATAMAAAQTLQARLSHSENRKTFNIVLCPSHVAKKWVREIAETLPETFGVIVRSITDLNRLYDHFTQGDKNVYAVISKEKARDGYMKRPAVRWSRLHRGFLCPDCGGVIQVPETDDNSTYLVNADQFHFRKENGKNHKCPLCGSPLWTAVNPGTYSEWVKIGGYGWVYRAQVSAHYDKTQNPSVVAKLDEIRDNPDALFPAVGACRRYPLSSYIKRMYKGKLDGVIVDELHEYNNDSGQGDAMGEIFSAAKKVIGMTATLINGYASGIFHLLYRTMPRSMLQDGKRYGSPSEFNNEYGVVENIYQEEGLDYASNRRASKRRTRSRQLPGVSPLVFTRFLLEKTAFLSLSDMGKNLPDYEEIPIALKMAPEVADEYRRVEKALVNILKYDRKIAQRILSVYLNLLTVYPDQPYGQPPVLHPLSGEPLITPKDTANADTIGEKEQAVLDIVRRKAANREKVLVYTSWVRTDSQRKLMKLLTENGFHAEILSDKIRPDQREDWVQKRLASGMQVLITNPSLVETGLDLNAFTTLIFYSMGYKLFTLRQASRRSWRINQTAPKVEVYMLYYENTMQQKAMKLMASKLAVAGIIEGSFTEEGLAAMSDVQDMTSQMAKELMLGIKDNVEDIAASFKKMAIVNPDRPAAHAPVPAAIPETVFTDSAGQMDMVSIFQQEAESQFDGAMGSQPDVVDSQPEEAALFVPEESADSDNSKVITLVPAQSGPMEQSGLMDQSGHVKKATQTVNKPTQTNHAEQTNNNSAQTDSTPAAPAVKPARSRKKSQNTERSEASAQIVEEQNKPKRRKRTDPLDGQMDFFNLLAA
ncbi:MAG: DEAD/DEAH box helicase family protein, partial [Abditibacteriota bacterium]|nr:DEAD/DEAH box helicase family protein [Abditibacteriota bacterium]